MGTVFRDTAGCGPRHAQFESSVEAMAELASQDGAMGISAGKWALQARQMNETASSAAIVFQGEPGLNNVTQDDTSRPPKYLPNPKLLSDPIHLRRGRVRRWKSVTSLFNGSSCLADVTTPAEVRSLRSRGPSQMSVREFYRLTARTPISLPIRTVLFLDMDWRALSTVPPRRPSGTWTLLPLMAGVQSFASSCWRRS